MESLIHQSQRIFLKKTNLFLNKINNYILSNPFLIHKFLFSRENRSISFFFK